MYQGHGIPIQVRSQLPPVSHVPPPDLSWFFLFQESQDLRRRSLSRLIQCMQSLLFSDVEVSDYSNYYHAITNFEECGIIEILMVNKYGNVNCVHFCITGIMDVTGQLFGGGIINYNGEFFFSPSTIYTLMKNRIEYCRIGPVVSFLGNIIIADKTLYIAELENHSVVCLDYCFIGVENINAYHSFDTLGNSVMLDLIRLELIDLQIIGVDSTGTCNPFTRADDKSSGDLLFMMGYTMSKNIMRKEYFVFTVNLQRLKTSCLCKGSNAGWNNFLGKYSKQFRTACFDTFQSDGNGRMWRTNKNFMMHIEYFQEVM